MRTHCKYCLLSRVLKSVVTITMCTSNWFYEVVSNYAPHNVNYSRTPDTETYSRTVILRALTCSYA